MMLKERRKTATTTAGLVWVDLNDIAFVHSKRLDRVAIIHSGPVVVEFESARCGIEPTSKRVLYLSECDHRLHLHLNLVAVLADQFYGRKVVLRRRRRRFRSWLWSWLRRHGFIIGVLKRETKKVTFIFMTKNTRVLMVEL